MDVTASRDAAGRVRHCIPISGCPQNRNLALPSPHAVLKRFRKFDISVEQCKCNCAILNDDFLYFKEIL